MSAADVRDDFGSTTALAKNETAAGALSQRHQAEVNARYIMAERHPRKVRDFEQKLKDECERPGFAARAEYALPRGYEEDEDGNRLKDKDGKWIRKFVKGPTIRFVETAIRLFTNVYSKTSVIYESDEYRIVDITVIDLENNIPYSTEVTVPKTVERKGAVKGRIILSERETSDGKTVYVLQATDEEVTIKQNALQSKALRTLALRFLPIDIVDAAIETARETLEKGDAADPKAALAKLLDAFNDNGVLPSELEAFLGHSVDRVSPSELKNLRAIYAAIASGETTWHKIMAAENPQQTADDAAKIAKEKAARLKAEAEKAAASASGTTQQATTEEPAKPTTTQREPGDEPADDGKSDGDSQKPMFGQQQSSQAERRPFRGRS